jgi:hypothetical protein
MVTYRLLGGTKLTSFVDAMKQASEVIKQENPDYLIVPMLGSVPLVDTMAIVDKDFDSSKAVYMPASSRILDVKKVIKDWYLNFLGDIIHSPEIFPKVLGIDEVVSGQSVTRCFENIDSATESTRRKIRQSLVERLHSKDLNCSLNALGEVDVLTDNAYALELANIRNKIIHGEYKNNKEKTKRDSEFVIGLVKDVLSKHLIYKTIGIEDSKKEERTKIYEGYKKQGRVIPIGVETIVTMDEPTLIPPRFELLPEAHRKNNYVQFSPKVVDFKVTPEYINFLRTISNYVGRNPDDVCPINMTRILDSARYISKNH